MRSVTNARAIALNVGTTSRNKSPDRASASHAASSTRMMATRTTVTRPNPAPTTGPIVTDVPPRLRLSPLRCPTRRSNSRLGTALRRSCRTQPSLNSFGDVEEQHAHQHDKSNRCVSPGQVVALGQFVDQLTEAAEVDQELDADNINHREDQPEPQAHEYRRQRRGQHDLPEHLCRREVERAADVDQNGARGCEAFERLQDHRRKRG